jgi:hypothetical protein
MAELEIPKLTTVEALRIFAEDSAPERRHAALTVLIASKFLPKNAEDEAIQTGRSMLLRDALSNPDPGYRLLSIADLIRLAQVVQRWLPEIANDLVPVFAEQLPPLSMLPGDGKARRNVARACAMFDAEWMLDYIASSIADEKDSDLTRDDFVELLLTRSTSLANALRLLSVHFERLRPQTKKPADTVAKRLTGTLAAFRKALMESHAEVGHDLGKALQVLLIAAFKSTGKPQDEAATELSAEVILAVHDIVRTRISVVADPAMYLAVAYCRQLCGRVWPDVLRKPLDRLVTDLCEALVLLGKQGLRDQGLLDQLEVLCKYPERARTLAKELAAHHPELPEEVRDWLEQGRIRTPNVASGPAKEAAASNADAAIGMSLQTARQARRNSESLRERLIPSLEIFEPALVAPANECIAQVIATAVQVEQAAALRQLELYGTPGEEVEMAPKFFNALGDSPRQRMVVRQPALIRKRSDGGIGEVVLKGLVE